MSEILKRALDIGLEYAKEALVIHDTSLGRSTKANFREARRIEEQIELMEHAIKSLGDPHWLTPETAPKNETAIIADFGWPWAVTAIWCKITEEWAITQLASCGEDDAREWETEWQKDADLKGWMPMPTILNKRLPS